ncbi:MAG: transposase [FCB group bacterium]|nr:transposase [FCB group bacterium]
MDADAESRSGMLAWDDVVWPSEEYVPWSGYRRYMPHWRLKGGLYFVTFRLADSIPRGVVEGWIEERRTWLTAWGVIGDVPEEEQQRRYLAIPEDARRVFERDMARKYFVELDKCHGSCLLRRQGAARIVADALQFHEGARLRGGDFVVMPNHVHWLLMPLGDHALEDILQSVKHWAAIEINKLVGRRGRLWQKESYDHLVRNPEQLERICGYIERNPEKAGLKSGEGLYYVTPNSHSGH